MPVESSPCSTAAAKELTSSPTEASPNRRHSPNPPNAKPKRSILRRNSSDSDLTRRHEVMIKPTILSCSAQQHRPPYSQTRNSTRDVYMPISLSAHLKSMSNARTPPRIYALLRKQYSPEVVRRVPPIISTCVGGIGGSSGLAEPYEITLKKAKDKGVDISPTKERLAQLAQRQDSSATSSEDGEHFSDGELDVRRRRSKVTFGDVRIGIV